MSNLCQPSDYDATAALAPRIVRPRRSRERIVFTTSEESAAASRASTFDELADAPVAFIKRHRTGDVGRIEAPRSPFGLATIRKRYWYPTARDRWRGLLRTTWLAPSRVEREAESLEQLASAGLQPRLFLAFGERRALGVLHDSFLITRELDARPLDEVMRLERDAASRAATLRSLGTFVGRLHARGFVDRDLHLRNLLVGRDLAIAKVDSPFAAIVPRWRRAAGQRRDLADLVGGMAGSTTPDERDEFESAYRHALAE